MTIGNFIALATFRWPNMAIQVTLLKKHVATSNDQYHAKVKQNAIEMSLPLRSEFGGQQTTATCPAKQQPPLSCALQQHQEHGTSYVMCTERKKILLKHQILNNNIHSCSQCTLIGIPYLTHHAFIVSSHHIVAPRVLVHVYHIVAPRVLVHVYHIISKLSTCTPHTHTLPYLVSL